MPCSRRSLRENPPYRLERPRRTRRTPVCTTSRGRVSLWSRDLVALVAVTALPALPLAQLRRTERVTTRRGRPITCGERAVPRLVRAHRGAEQSSCPPHQRAVTHQPGVVQWPARPTACSPTQGGCRAGGRSPPTSPHGRASSHRHSASMRGIPQRSAALATWARPRSSLAARARPCSSLTAPTRPRSSLTAPTRRPGFTWNVQGGVSYMARAGVSHARVRSHASPRPDPGGREDRAATSRAPRLPAHVSAPATIGVPAEG